MSAPLVMIGEKSPLRQCANTERGFGACTKPEKNIIATAAEVGRF